MNITKQLLQEHDACQEGVDYFCSAWGEGAEVDVQGVIARLEKEKDTEGYIRWLVTTFSLSGLARWWYENGQLWYEATYEQDRRHGLARWWYENGQLWREATYAQGKRHGLACEWHSNGQLESEATYEQGNPHGLYRSWHKNGQLWREETYERGESVYER